MVKTYSIRVKGRVQGVFFRASAKDRADELEVIGFVRNEPDGSVYIEAQAEEDLLEDFLHWCRRGPEHARVESCDVVEIAWSDYKGFTISR